MLFIMIVLALYVNCIDTSAADVSQLESAVKAASDAVKPALVRIHVVSVDDRDGREIKSESFGSGAIISADGYVITNHHVAGHASQITCTLWDRSLVDAELIATDALTDIAVIKLIPEEETEFHTAKFGDSSLVKVGDYVLAMGSPLSLSQSVTLGIVSNTEMVSPPSFGRNSLTLDGEDVGSIVRWIGHDAEIHPGNSGGPLVNMNGEIIGINEVSIGLGGAIPGNLANDVSQELIRNGMIKRAWLGLIVQPLLRSSEVKNGVLIGGSINGAPAQAADFRPGDILLRLGDRDVTVRFPEEVPLFNEYVMSLETGVEIKAVVLRDGNEIELKVTPVERSMAQAKAVEFRDWGMTARGITRLSAVEDKLENTAGVRVTSVRTGGPSADAKPALRPGDVILNVKDKSINCLDDLVIVTKEILVGKSDPVSTLVEFKRGKDEYLTVVKLGIQDVPDAGLEVSKAWIPVGFQVLTREIAEVLGMEGQTGIRITRIYPPYTEEQLGLKVGDIVTELDGVAIPAARLEDMEVFPALIRQYKIGSDVELTVNREGTEVKVAVNLPQSPKLPREMPKYQNDDFDLTVRDIAFFDRISKGLSVNSTGVLVENVTAGGWAALGGLRLSDLIISVDGHEVDNVEAFKQIMERIIKDRPVVVIIHVKRGSFSEFVEMRPIWPDKAAEIQ